MEHQSKPLMRSLMYLHLNHTTNGNRAPLVVQKPKILLSTIFSWVLALLAVVFLSALFIPNV